LITSKSKKRAVGIRRLPNPSMPLRGSLGRYHSAEMGITRGVIGLGRGGLASKAFASSTGSRMREEKARLVVVIGNFELKIVGLSFSMLTRPNDVLVKAILAEERSWPD